MEAVWTKSKGLWEAWRESCKECRPKAGVHHACWIYIADKTHLFSKENREPTPVRESSGSNRLKNCSTISIVERTRR